MLSPVLPDTEAIRVPTREVDCAGLRSLEDVLEANATHYVFIGELFAHFDGMFDGKLFSGFEIPQDRLVFLRTHLPELARHCSQLELEVTKQMILDFCREYKDKNPTWDASLTFLKCMRQAFKAEIGSCLFLHVNRERVRYYTRQVGAVVSHGSEIAELFDVIAGGFPSAYSDAIEAGQCLTLERFTASVYHLMRVAEVGLVAVADSLEVVPKNPSWDGIIGAVNGELNKVSSGASKPSGWKEREEFYRDALSWIGDIKVGWRNPVSHHPRLYSESQARGILISTKNLLDHLSSNGIKEPVVMPEMPLP